MISCMLVAPNKRIEYGGAELINDWNHNENSTLWIDLCDVSPESEKEMLLQLNCHPLAIADLQRERHPPKIELFDDYIFLLYRGVLEREEGLKFEHLQVSFFIGIRLLISRHTQNTFAINALFKELGGKYLKRSPAHLALRIFHYSCGVYLEELFNFESELEMIEDEFQQHGTDMMMRQITLYRSQLVKLKRTFNYHVNIGQALSAYINDEDTDVITNKDIHTVNDLNERLERLLSLSQMYYDICGDLINGYISVSSHQLNTTMRILTVITAIFVPLSFLAGIYGMNFEFMPELKVQYGYYALLASMAFIAMILIMIFKRKHWL